MAAWSDLRRRWRSTLALALIVGIVGAVVFAAVAGARRSDSALARFNASSRSADIEVSPGEPSPTGAQLAQLRNASGVAAVGVLRVYGIRPTNIQVPNLAIGAPVDATMNNAVDRPRLIHGRFADPNAPDEVDVGESLVALAHLGVGDTLDLESWTQTTINKIFLTDGFLPPDGPKLHLHVVGIVRRPLDLGERAGQGGVVTLTPAFNTKYGNVIGTFNGTAMRIRTKTPADIPAVTESVRQLWGKNKQFEESSLSVDNTGAGDAIRVLGVALLIFAAVAALAGVVAISIVMNRELASARRDQPALLAVGAGRRSRFAIAALRVGLIAVIGSLVAAVVAITASPLFPFGIARRADPDPGVHADWMVLLLGIGVVIVLLSAIGGVIAWRITRVASVERVARRATASSRVVQATAAAGLPVSVATGVRLAVEPGRGDQAVPLRSAILGGVFAMAGVTAVFVFASSLASLAATPKLYGATFQFRVADNSNRACDATEPGLTKLAGIASLEAICYENIQVGDRASVGFGAIEIKGSGGPEIVQGRRPATSTEVALGAATLAGLHKHVGDTVVASTSLGRSTYRIVGRAVFPELGDAQPLADGGWFTQDGMNRLLGTIEQQQQAGNFTRYFVGTYSPNANRPVVAQEIAQRMYDPSGNFPANVTGPQQPVEITRLRQTNWFPWALAALLGFLALVAIGHALVAGTRRRRPELAMLKTLGFERSQIRGAIGWEASALASVSLGVGIPLGLFIGTVIWRSIADGLGVANAPVVPWTFLALIPVAIVAVNLIAFFPGRTAARMRPAVALRSE
jgi:hypothetical protein